MKAEHALQMEQLQKLVMTPELIQTIHILQLNVHELEAYIDEQLVANPMLEVQPRQESAQEEPEKARNEIDWEEYFKDNERYDDISYRQWEGSQPDQGFSSDQLFVYGTTLKDYLLSQLQLVPIDYKHRKIGIYIIEALDQNGYLRLSKKEIAQKLNVTQGDVRYALTLVQSLEPAGVGARSLEECLYIQLERLGLLNEQIFAIIHEHMEDVACNRLPNIARALKIPVKEVQRLLDIIKGLEPKPGRPFATGEDLRYIVPDVSVEKVDDHYVVNINESASPRLTISNSYKRMLCGAEKHSSLSSFLNDRLNSAVWLIRSLELRKQTIFKVVQALVDYQKDFLEYGEKHLKILTLKMIAETVGVHESTVSRAISGKYVQTPRGIYELKYFFTYGVSDNYGQGISSHSIKAFIKEIVDKENPHDPLSDQDIVAMLGNKGISISRRTVAKYRGNMRIAPANKRKRF